MPDDNKRNLLFFEGDSMKSLYETMGKWQDENRTRLLSTNIQQDGGKFCCIALTNPTEVIICDGNGEDQARVSGRCLSTAGSY